MDLVTRFFIAVAFLVASTSSQWTPSPLCPYPSEKLTRFPYEGDCSKYWECYEGARYPMECAAGLEFSAELNRCDTPSVANCDPDATIIYPTFSHSTVSTTTSEPTPDPGPKPECPFPSDELVFFPVANNCSLYWECFQGNRYLMTCPEGLYWNTLVDYCDYAENVDCSRNNVTTTTTGPTTTITTDGPITSGTSTTSGPSTTESNAETTEERPSTTQPPPTQEPASTTEPPPTQEPVSTTTPNPVCNDQPDGTYLPNPTDCSKYYECVGHKPIDGQCKNDLLWNQDALTCDFPQNVICEVENGNWLFDSIF